MAILLCLAMFLIILFAILYFRRFSSRIRKSMWPRNWTIVKLVTNTHRFHEYVTDILKKTGGTYVFKGFWFANMDCVITADPANIQYILSKNFSNYPKGPEFKQNFDVFGDTSLNSDFKAGESLRKIYQTFMNNHKFKDLTELIIRDKLDNRLIPFLEYASNTSVVVDFQDVFQRLSFDILCTLALDCNVVSLSADLPHIPFEKAFKVAEEVIFFRHLLPEFYWKLQRKLGVGKEKKFKEAAKNFDENIYPCLSSMQDNDGSFKVSTYLTELYEETGGAYGDPKKFSRDTLLGLMLAGKNTLSTALTWLFWLLSRNPLVIIKIREEIKNMSNVKRKLNNTFSFEARESDKLVYLHAALCETLRLYPPVSVEHKSTVEPDTLPSGHKTNRNTKIVLFFYSTGRMETIWGKDCLEFKPERWITETGGVKREPFYKFPAFNGGPRTCLGINMAFAEMKAIAATIIYNYEIEVVEGQSITPGNSIILAMKDGLNVRITKRSV